MNDASPKAPPARGVSATTLILSVALAVASTTAVVLAVLYLSGTGRPASAVAPGQQSAAAPPTASAEKDTVKPLGQPAGEVFYETPFASPPHLTLSAPHRIYRIVKQDEFGFSWEADSVVEDFVGDAKDVGAAFQSGRLDQLAKKPRIDYEDFTYEAKGIPAGPGVEFERPLDQEGSFQTIIGTQGQENFAVPYASPPQITLRGKIDTTVVVDATATGFKWKNGGTDAFFNNGTVNWTAKGIRAMKLPK
jgi:hypothetical protein